MKELEQTPASIIVAIGKLLALLLAATLIAYLFQGIEQNKWWPADYIESLAIPLTFVPIFVWLAFVPKRLRFDDGALELTPRYSGIRLLPFSALRHWGYAEGILILEFERTALRRRTIQIALSFYTSEARSELLRFLSANFAKQKTNTWLGTMGLSIGSR